MTIWFIIPAVAVEETKDLYLQQNIRGGDALEEDEKMSLIPDRTAARYYAGSSRITLGEAETFRLGDRTRSTVLDNWPPVVSDSGGVWDWPVEKE